MAEINDLNITDASNTARWPEGMAPSAVNNAARADEGIIARFVKDAIESTLTGGGTADAITVAANRTLSAYYDGLQITFDVASANTGAVTLNVDSVGAKKVLKNFNSELVSGDLVAGQKVVVKYDSDGDGGAGSWQVVSPTPPSEVGTGQLADNSVTTAKIADGAVTADKLASGAAAITGEVKQYIGTTAPTGWLFLNGDTLGSAASAATQNSDSYETLWKLFYDSMVDAQAAVSGGRTTRDADWAANKTLTMPDARGRALIGSGTGAGLTARTHGDTGGAETHTLTAAESGVPAHNHPPAGAGSFVRTTQRFTDGGGPTFANIPYNTSLNGTTGNNAAADAASSHNNVQPFLALNMIIKF